MNAMKSWFSLALAGLAFPLAACGGGSPSTLQGGASSGIACQAIALIAPSLAYPAPNATNVPINISSLVFYSYANPLVVPMDIQITANGTNQTDLGNIKAAPSVIPAPTAAPPTPPPANLGSVALPAPLVRGVVYSVLVQSPPGGCPLIGQTNLGVFTTTSN